MLACRKGEVWEGREKNSFQVSLSSTVILNCHSQDKQTKNRFRASFCWIRVGQTFSAFTQTRTQMQARSWVHAHVCTHTLPRKPARQTSAPSKVKAPILPVNTPSLQHLWSERNVENSPSEETRKECVWCWLTPRLAIRFVIWRHFCFMAESKVASVPLAEWRPFIPHASSLLHLMFS